MDNKFKNKRVAIIGLGLIGGSLARAFRERLGISDIIAVNPTSEALEEALKDNVISMGFTELNTHVYNSDVVVLCTPVKRTLEYLKILADKVKPDCIITDVGSTKSEVVACMNNMPGSPCFIGGHPMAGAEKSGYSASLSHLFENAYYILTPCKSTSSLSIDLMSEMINGIGAIPIIMDAAQHDKIAGTISHIPHIIASALVNMVKEQDAGDGKMQMLAAGGFKDITRIASSNPEMWENITLSNKQYVSDILEKYIICLNRYRGFIDAGDSKEVYDFFNSAKIFRDTFSNTGKGLLQPVYDIIADVVDKPGIIGEIATILGNKGINIKNINVSNSREYELGCLRISLPDAESLGKSFDLLIENGYKVYKV
ncbi:MAG: prephenate dehydrogenase [Clostridiales bacterium]|jgi:prephenate dehydrogenase|nr:prephenate dehydrogenase [Clostridiales bacterium]